jgi:signal transduction histidine kinase
MPTNLASPSDAAPSLAAALVNGQSPESADPAAGELLSAVLNMARAVLWEGTAQPLAATRIVAGAGAPSGFERLPKGKAWAEALFPGDAVRVSDFFATVADRPLPAACDYRLVLGDGALHWVRHHVFAAEPSRDGYRLLGCVADLSETKALESECLRVSEREQSRIGQELHDDLCQVLAGLSCLMRVVEARVARRVPEEVPALREINQQLIEAMDRTRALTHGLFPAGLKSRDLRAALEELGLQLGTRFGLKVTVRARGQCPEHDDAQIRQIFRIAQEAASNALKHGRATELVFALETRPGLIVLEVRDNGCGLATEPAVSNGIGLHIMRQRAAQLGGTVTLRRRSRRGAILALHYPTPHAP